MHITLRRLARRYARDFADFGETLYNARSSEILHAQRYPPADAGAAFRRDASDRWYRAAVDHASAMSAAWTGVARFGGEAPAPPRWPFVALVVSPAQGLRDEHGQPVELVDPGGYPHDSAPWDGAFHVVPAGWSVRLRPDPEKLDAEDAAALDIAETAAAVADQQRSRHAAAWFHPDDAPGQDDAYCRHVGLI